MKNTAEFKKEYKNYLELYPQEAGELERFSRFIDKYDGEELFDRRNFDGHIMASGIIIDTASREMLLLYHLQLGKWLQPGGHVDPCDRSILDAAYREIEEETGILPTEILLVGKTGMSEIFDINSHYIPRSDHKNEQEHYHHDVRYLFSLTSGRSLLDIDPLESGGYRWVKYDDIPGHFGFQRIIRKLKKIDPGK